MQTITICFFIFKLLTCVRLSRIGKKRYSLFSFLGHVQLIIIFRWCSDKNFILPPCAILLKFWAYCLFKIYYKNRKQWLNCHKKHPFTFLWMMTTRQVAVHVEKIKSEEWNNCCFFIGFLWKSMTIVFAWIYTVVAISFSWQVLKQILPLDVCLCWWLCYVTFLLFLFGLVCF